MDFMEKYTAYDDKYVKPAALGGLVYGASKLMKRAAAYDYPGDYELHFKSLPKIAALAAAAKIVKGVGSTLKSGAGNVAFSAVGAGLNQTPKQSNNFNPPESEG